MELEQLKLTPRSDPDISARGVSLMTARAPKGSVTISGPRPRLKYNFWNVFIQIIGL